MAVSRVRLATPTAALLEPLTRWERDADILALSADDETPMRPEAVAAMLERWQTPRPDDVAFAVLLEEQPIGFVRLALIEPAHARCKLGVVIGEKSLWGQGYGRQALELALAHAFETLGLVRVSAEIYATNERSLRLFESVGFVREGVLRQSVVKAGQRVDEICVSLLRDEWAARR